MEMGGWTRLLIAGLVAGPVSDARAEGPMPAAASACHFEAAGAGKVSAIIDGRSFVLDDGREVRLAGIEVRFRRARRNRARAEAGFAARAALRAILAGQKVELRQPGPDRTTGWPHSRPCLRGMRSAEFGRPRMLATGYRAGCSSCGGSRLRSRAAGAGSPARQAKLGLWGEPYYGSSGPRAGPSFWRKRGHFTWWKARCCRSAKAEARST